MASPTWLGQEPTSTSQASSPDLPFGRQSTAPSTPTAAPASVVGIPSLKDANGSASDSTKLPPAKSVAASGYVATPPSFSYVVPPFDNTSSGSSQQASSSPDVKSNSVGSSVFLQTPAPSLSASSGPFSYNTSHSGIPVPGGHQFPPNMNATDQVAQGSSVSSAPPVSHSFSQPALSTSRVTSSTFNSGTPTFWMPSAPTFQVPPAGFRNPVMPGNPGIITLPSSSNTGVQSASLDSSQSARIGPMIPATLVQSNTSLHQKIIAPYPSNPRIAPPQGPWLQSPQINVLPRPPLLSYPSTFPLPVHGIPHPFFALPDSRPPGLTHIGAPGVTSTLPAASGSQLAIGSLVQPELPPGSDNSKHVNDAAVPVEQLNAWSAHKIEGGAVYYYNAFTGESTYQKPSGFKGELDKVTTQTTPVSWEKCAGTDWSLVTTNDGKRYFYNTNTKLSSWQIPTEVTESRRKQNDEAMKEQSSSLPDTDNSTGKVSAAVSLSAPAVTTGGRDATALRILGVPGSSSALDLIKKKLQESGAPSTSSSLPPLSVAVPTELNGSVEVAVKGPHSENGKDKMKDANADANLTDSSSDSEDVDIGPSKEECAIQFKEMLKERGVAPFSKWEKELPKFVFDPRFKAIPGYSARRALFEHYVRTRAEEERKEKRAAQKAATEGYKQLLEEAKEDIDHKTDYQTFKKKWGHDPRFVALDRKEREVLLNERVRPLKRCAEEEARAIREAAASTFISMLRDKGDITTGSRWFKVKDTLRNDPRYKSVKHEDREVLFNEYISKLKSAEEDAERLAKEKRDEEEKLKERERALRKRKEREEQEVERVRSKARRKEAIESYQALLVETIKDPQVSWTDSKPKLEKDPQGRAANPNLDKSDLEKLFREHVKMLHDRCAHDFRALLAEVITGATALEENEEEGGKTPLTSWSTAKRLLKADPRYAKMPRKERESLWGRHVEEMERKHKIIVDPQDLEKNHTDKRSSVDSGKYRSGSRRNNERR